MYFFFMFYFQRDGVAERVSPKSQKTWKKEEKDQRNGEEWGVKYRVGRK